MTSPLATSALAALLLVACHPAVVTEQPTVPGPAAQDAVSPRSPVPESRVPPTERWRPEWTITGHFVADLGASLLMRHDRTSEDVTFTLFDAATG